MNTPNEALVSQLQTAALEAEALQLGFVSSDFIKKFNGLMGGMKDYMSDIVKDFGVNKTLPFAPNAFFDRKLAKSSYTVVQEKDVIIPPGLNVTYLKLLDAMEDSQLIADRLLHDTMVPALRYFSLLLALPENLESGSMVRNFTIVNLFVKERETAKKKMTPCYVQNHNSVRARFGDCFERLADWPTACEKLMDLNERMSKASPAQVNKKISELCDIIDRLIITMAARPDAYRINGVNAKALADLTIEIARVAEFFAAYCFMLQTVNSAFTDNRDHINRYI